MTLDELNIWIKAHKYVTSDEDSYDSSGNHYETRIYEACMRDGKFFAQEDKNGRVLRLRKMKIYALFFFPSYI